MRPSLILVAFLLIEFVDELMFGAKEAAWPLIRDDLHLTYTEIGLLFAIPAFTSSLIEPALGILSDTGRRRHLILVGGVCFSAALGLMAFASGFGWMLAALMLFYPASGAFVSLAQTALMDNEPSRREYNMARWTLAGSLGVVSGPLLLGGLVWIGTGWRGVFGLLSAISAGLTVAIWRILPADPSVSAREKFSDSLRGAFEAIRSPIVIRWLALLECSDLMLDVLLGFLALYLVDAAGFTVQQAGIAVAVWSGVGLLGDILLIPLLERVRGLPYLRFSAAVMFLLYPAFLIMPGIWMKYILLGLMGLFNAGWYAILQARLYQSLPGRSGAALVANNVAGLVGGWVPGLLGLLASEIGIGGMMWALLIGPLVLLLALPRGSDLTDTE